jgi:hypothetical protein
MVEKEEWPQGIGPEAYQKDSCKKGSVFPG